MHSSFVHVLRRRFAHGFISRTLCGFTRTCKHFSNAKRSPSVLLQYNATTGRRLHWNSIVQCNVRPFSSSCVHRPNNRPKRICSRLAGGLRVIGLVNYENWVNSIHSMNFKMHSYHPVKEFSSDISRQTVLLKGTIDRFNGVRINMEEQLRINEVLTLTADDNRNLKDSLLRTLSYYQAENKPAVWLEISVECGHVIPTAAEVGFSFHHAEKNHVMMYIWLDEGESRIPEYATHQVGVSGFVLDQERQQVLMVQDRHRIARWKFPGGYSKLGEDFSETAKREVFEETGIRTEFQSILAFRQQHQMPYSFNRSDIYVVCRLEPVTFDVTACNTELIDAKWIPLKELFCSEVHTALTMHVAALAKRGIEEGFQDVDIRMSELPSVYKGMTYKLFSRC